MTKPDFLTFADQDGLISRLTADILDTLQGKLEKQGRATLVVSGGKTPEPLFEQLATEDFPWHEVTITLADERWIDQDSDQSNEHLVRTRLMKSNAAAAHFIGLKNDAATPHEAELVINSRLAALPQPFDLILLGMGNDGHTASLFPGSQELKNALSPPPGKLCCGVTPVDTAHERMTLTLSALLATEKIFIHITGPEKLAVYEKALRGKDILEMPIRAILHQQIIPVTTYWAP